MAISTYGIPATALTASACIESGYGWTRIGLSENNLFGWKYYSATAGGGRGHGMLGCRPDWPLNIMYEVFTSRRDCVLFISMKLATMSIHKDDTDPYVSDIGSGVAGTTGGDATWYGSSLYYYTGGDSIRNGQDGHIQSSWVQFTVQGNKTLRFEWRVDSQASGHYLEL